jgi:hypothetical protein
MYTSTPATRFFVEAAMLTVPWTVLPLRGAVIKTGELFETLTWTDERPRYCPLEPKASAESVWLPLFVLVESQVRRSGGCNRPTQSVRFEL